MPRVRRVQRRIVRLMVEELARHGEDGCDDNIMEVQHLCYSWGKIFGNVSDRV